MRKATGKGVPMVRKLKLICAAVICATAFPTAGLAATAFDGINALVQNNFQSQFSEVQGVLAVGGNATLFNYGVDLFSTPYGGAGGYGLVVGGNLTFSSGSVGTLVTNPAQTYYGGTLSGSSGKLTRGVNNVKPPTFRAP